MTSLLTGCGWARLRREEDKMAIKYIIETKKGSYSKSPCYWFWKKADKKEKNLVYTKFGGAGMFKLVSFSSTSLDKILGGDRFGIELISIGINDNIEIIGKFPSYQKSLIRMVIGYYKAAGVLVKK